MADRYLSPQIWHEFILWYPRKRCLRTTDGWTDDEGRPRDDSSSAVQQHKAELKMCLPTERTHEDSFLLQPLLVSHLFRVVRLTMLDCSQWLVGPRIVIQPVTAQAQSHI